MDVFTDNFVQALMKTIKGYHLINDAPIKEAVWENIVSLALKRANISFVWYQGRHVSGKDFMINGKGVSCKTCKETNNNLDISSYRLTTCANSNDFAEQIDQKRANFQYTLLLSRIENTDGYVYNVYAIPAHVTKVGDKVFRERLNKRNEKIVGWDTECVDGVRMRIEKSMSNQLWIRIKKSKMMEYCVVDSVQVSNVSRIDYVELFEQFATS